jgi:replicative DNA helicase
MTAPALDLVEVGCLEAGRSVLGTALAGSTAAREALGHLQSDDLTDTRQRAVLEAIQALITREAPIDPVTVLGELRAGGTDVRMPAGRDAGVFLADLMEHAMTGHPGFHVRVILEYALRRDMRRAGMRIQQAAGSSPIGHLLDFIAQELNRVVATEARLKAAS